VPDDEGNRLAGVGPIKMDEANSMGGDAPEERGDNKLEKMLEDLRRKKDMQKLAYDQGVDLLLNRYNTITFKQPKGKSSKDKKFSNTGVIKGPQS
jgi:hypothetical protein